MEECFNGKQISSYKRQINIPFNSTLTIRINLIQVNETLRTFIEISTIKEM